MRWMMMFLVVGVGGCASFGHPVGNQVKMLAPVEQSPVRYALPQSGYATVLFVEPGMGAGIVYSDVREAQRGVHAPDVMDASLWGDTRFLSRMYLRPDSYFYLLETRSPVDLRGIDGFLGLAAARGKNIELARMAIDSVLGVPDSLVVGRDTYHLFGVRRLMDTVRPGCLDEGMTARQSGASEECQESPARR